MRRQDTAGQSDEGMRLLGRFFADYIQSRSGNLPDFRASARSVSLTRPPLAVLISTAPFFHGGDELFVDKSCVFPRQRAVKGHKIRGYGGLLVSAVDVNLHAESLGDAGYSFPMLPYPTMPRDFPSSRDKGS